MLHTICMSPSIFYVIDENSMRQKAGFDLSWHNQTNSHSQSELWVRQGQASFNYEMVSNLVEQFKF